MGVSRLFVCVSLWHQCENAPAGIPETELEALIDFYRSTNGPTWRKNKWPKELQDTTRRAFLKPCEWRGVKCRRGHVVELSLEKSLGGGTLPASLAALSQVEVIDLGSNKLQGTLPPEWGAGMKACHQIEMDGNHFTGMVPAEWGVFTDMRAPPRPGASAGGARIFLGFNKHVGGEHKGKFGFECPYPEFLQKKTEVTRNGKKAMDSNIATAWGLPSACGTYSKDITPDEEEPLKKGGKRKSKSQDL